MGVVEDFTHKKIRQILTNARRVLKLEGITVIFWPHARATRVAALHAWHWLLHRAFKRDIQLHPPGISLIKSKQEVVRILQDTGFAILCYRFGYRDLFIQVKS